jgi:hypothetical protein
VDSALYPVMFVSIVEKTIGQTFDYYTRASVLFIFSTVLTGKRHICVRTTHGPCYVLMLMHMYVYVHVRVHVRLENESFHVHAHTPRMYCLFLQLCLQVRQISSRSFSLTIKEKRVFNLLSHIMLLICEMYLGATCYYHMLCFIIITYYIAQL